MALTGKITVLIILMFLYSLSVNAQLVNKSILYIGEETTLSVQSDITNDVGAMLHNEGTLVIQGSLTNNSKYNGFGTVEMADHDQFTTIQLSDTIHKLILSESDYTELSQDMVITDSIIFNGGDLLLSGHTLMLPDTIGFRNQSSTGHITTNSGKIVLVNFDNANGVELPVSYSPDLGYTPITIANTGAADHFTIQMADSVTDNGQRSGNIISSNDRVEAMWMLDDSLNTAYSLDITLKWQSDEEGSSFDTTNCGIAVYENGNWDMDPNDLDNSSNRSRSKSGITNIENIAFAIGDGESDMASGLMFALKVFLQGPYITATDSMHNGINGIIPSAAADSSVYGNAPYSYNGTESFSTAPPNAVDWVLVELRDASSAATATSSTTLATAAGLLMQDGTIKASNGIGNIAFRVDSNSINNNIYVVIRHRNHLDIMSSTAVTPEVLYDFSTAATQAYGTNAQLELETGVYGLYAGDVNGDHKIIYNGANSDRGKILDLVGYSTTSSPFTGYSNQDVNMDGSAIFNGGSSDRAILLERVGFRTTSSPVSGQVPD